MADNVQWIRDLFKTANVPLVAKDVWEVQGTPVVKHRALERLAATIGISFLTPQVLRAERDEAVLLVTGTKGDKAEWSIGEAVVTVNYRVSPKVAAYVYAMAEKRAKDRVILKLAGLHGVYSEEEADEFKGQSDGPTMTDLLTAAEAGLRAAAAEGSASLKTAWSRLDGDLKPALKKLLDETLKPLAASKEAA